MTVRERILILAAAVMLVFTAVVMVKYTQLQSLARESCLQTGAAAKLDLSGMVPLCRMFPHQM